MVTARSFAIGALTLSAALAAHAHHSPAAYDSSSEVTVTGTVTKFEWANPHVYVSVKESTDAGATWLVELVSPSSLKQLGWSPTTLAVGDAVRFTGMPGRNRARNIAYLLLLEKSGDVVLDLRAVSPRARTSGGPPPAPAAPPRPPGVKATSIAGTWGTVFGPSFAQLLPNSASLPVTAKGAAAIAAFTDAANPGRDCVQFAAPVYMVLPIFRRIEIGEDSVVIRGEEGDVTRTGDLRRRTHDGAVPSVHGDSIGRWEGDALVVDTTHFSEHRLGNGGALPSSPMKHLVERFELTPDGSALTYTFALDDPEYLTETVRGAATWVYRPDVTYAGLPCSIDNARRFLAE